jgi:beta-lactamase regulating signal transducer with metallopeptidase domain
METLLRIGLSNAVAALLLALVVVAVACVWRRPAVLHALWLLVLVKLITPPLVWLPDPWTEEAAPAVAPKAGDPAPEPVQVDPPTDMAVVDLSLAADPSLAEAGVAPDGPLILAPVPESPEGAPTANSEEAGLRSEESKPIAASSLLTPHSSLLTSAPAPAGPSWVPAVCVAWLAGSLAWYVLALWRLRRFRRLLRHAVPAPESLRQRTQRLAAKLQLRRCPDVWLVPGRVAPMLWAAGGRPRILFPADLLGQTTPEQQNALLVHELAHLRRRDHWVRWLEFAAAGLHWWNPVLWFARRELREAEELCCDAWVTSTLPDAGKAYATALLETLDFLSDAPPGQPLLASGVGRVSDLKRRLTMIMRGTTPRALGWRGLLAVVGLGALLLPLLPAWARGQTPPRPDPDKKQDYQFLRLDGDLLFKAADPAPATPEDVQKFKAELEQLAAQLEQKRAEMAELQAKMEDVKARLAKTAAPGKGRIVVQVDAGADDGALKDLLKKLQAQPPGAANAEVIVIDAATGKIIMKTEGAKPAPPGAVLKWEFKPEPPQPPGKPGQPGLILVPAQPSAPADADKRIDELERKLKSILDEVEQLRKDRKPGAQEPGKPVQFKIERLILDSDGTIKIAPEPGKRPEHSPAPPENILHFDRFFRSANPAEMDEQAKALAAERDTLVKLLEELRARAEAEKERRPVDIDQAKAALDAARAALEQAESNAAAAEKAGNNPATNVDLERRRAEVAARRAALEQARALLEKSADEKIAQQEAQDRAKAAEAERKAAEERVRQLEEELQKLRDKLKERSNSDAPKKP